MEKIPSFIKLIESSVVQGWDAPALSDYMGKTYKYKDVALQIAKLHLVYEQMGLKVGDKVSLCGPNSSNWGVVYISLLTYGAVPVPILNAFQTEQIHNIVTHSESILLFAAENIYSQIDAKEMPTLEGILLIEGYSLATSNSEKLTSACEKLQTNFNQKYPNGLTAGLVKYNEEASSDTLAMINYTSGTTGFSKGVMIPYRALWGNYNFALQKMGKFIHRGDYIVSLLPMAHMYGMMFEFLFEFIHGCHVYFLTRTPTPSILTKAFAEIRPRVIVAVPLIIEKIVKKSIMPRLSKSKAMKYMKMPIIGSFVRRMICRQVMKAFGGNVYEVIVGGAALNKSVEKFLRSINFPIAIGYGATECAPIICYEGWKKLKPASCGKAVPYNEVKIDNTDPQNVPGEILVRGINVMQGYYKNEEATLEALDAEGWYHTGDMGLMDKEGNVFIKGRIKNMLLGASGQNIYPEEIEDKLNSMLMVTESIVVQRNGKLEALIYPDYDEAYSLNLTDENIVNIMNLNRVDLNEMLPAYERVIAVHVHKEEFEKTPKKSIKRFLYK